ncbi:hypothetical protein [Amycolatopsis anabasis]|uniref:hypothetical protein n=1 Tax=Amycolatopsis anabasis TaxID=1840409 RepID=UPI00131BAF95|nr:hypothetical protein [Amycolatopsis anabasis]
MHDQARRLARSLDRTIGNTRAEVARMADDRQAVRTAAEQSTKDLGERWQKRATAIRRRAEARRTNASMAERGKPKIIDFGFEEPGEPSGNPLDDMVRKDEVRDARANTATPLAEVPRPRYARRRGDRTRSAPAPRHTDARHHRWSAAPPENDTRR